MEEFRKDEIIYDEDWQRFDTPVINEKEQVDSVSDANNKYDKDKYTKKRERLFPALITIQLVVCMIIAFLVFMLKAMNSDTYAALCSWYDDMMSKTLLSNSTFEDIDLSQYLDATFDQVCATNDEV